MFIIEREISEYTHHNIILGIFENIEDATKAKESYIRYSEKKDKWAEQAYRTVDLMKDVSIRDITELVQNNNSQVVEEVFIISFFMEGFGQVTRLTKIIFMNNNAAKEYLTQKEAKEPEYEPSWYEIEMIHLNKIYFDK